MKFLIPTILTLLFFSPTSVIWGQVSDNEVFYKWLSQKHHDFVDLNTSQIIYSKEFNHFLVANITFNQPIYMGMSRKDDGKNLLQHIHEVLSGPPDKVEFLDKGTVIISGCRASSCPEKGFIWIDTVNKVQIFVIVSYFFKSKTYRHDGFVVIYTNDFRSQNKLPINFKETLDQWLHSHNFKNYEVKFVEDFN